MPPFKDRLKTAATVLAVAMADTLILIAIVLLSFGLFRAFQYV